MSKPDEISFATTWHIRDHCLCLHVQRAARMVARRFDEALRPLGLTNGQFSLLTSLNREEPATMGATATLLAMDRTTLTAALKPLQRGGYVEVTIDPELDAAFPKQRAARVAFTARDGRQEEFLQPTRIGDPEAPLSDAQLDGKYLELAVPVIGESKAKALLQKLWKLETEKSLAP